MSSRAIAPSEFDRSLPQNPALENLMFEPVEWFSNRSGNLLGTIARTPPQKEHLHTQIVV